MDLIFVWKSAILVTICFQVHIILSTSVPDNVSSNASSPCDEGWEHHGEFCIIMEKQPVYWRQASSNCISMGGNLPSIHSKQQNDLFLELSQRAGKNNLWIGLSDHDSNSIFEWQDGTVFGYKYWAAPTCFPRYIHIISDSRCFDYCIHYGPGHFRRISENSRHFGEDHYPFCHCVCDYVNAFSSGDCVALSTSENGRWRGRRCSLSFGYLCQKKITATTIAGVQDNDVNVTATTIVGAQDKDENVTATTISGAQDNDENVTATTISAAQDNDVNVTATTIAGAQDNDVNETATVITRTEVDNPTSTAITSTTMEVKSASTIITSTDVDDKTASTIRSSVDLDDKTATTITITDVDDRTAPVTLNAVSNVELKTVETTIITSTDVNRKTAANIFTSTNVNDKTAAATIDTGTDVNNGKTAIITMTTEEADPKIVAKYNGAKQDVKSSWFSVKTFIIILSIIIMFMALVGGLYYYKRPWLEKQKLKVTTDFFRRLRTSNRPSSSFVLNRNEKCDGSIDKYTTRYVSFRNKV